MSDLKRSAKFMCARPTKKPTVGEYKVIITILIVLAVGLGAFCVYFGHISAEKNPEEAAMLTSAGFILLSAGILGPIIGKFVIRNLFE
jgi:hypothetical protein